LDVELEAHGLGQAGHITRRRKFGFTKLAFPLAAFARRQMAFAWGMKFKFAIGGFFEPFDNRFTRFS
jgi:hypothetical protein